MKEVRCLYWDDEGEEDRRRYEGWIRRAWEKMETGVRIAITTVGSPDEALERLKQLPEAFDLLVADVYVGSDELDPRGLHLMDEVRNFPKLAIVALSRAADEGRMLALAAGADEFVSKPFLSRHDTSLRSLGDALFLSLRKKGHEPVQTEGMVLRVNDDDLLLAAVIETIGRENLIALVIKTVRPRRCISIEARFVRPGLSGALVLRVDCELEVGDRKAPETLSLLLKASRDASLLATEISNVREIATFPPSLFVSFGEGRVVDSGPWHAIGTRFQVSATTLVDWLSHGQSGDAVAVALSSLFLDGGLKDVYRHVYFDADERPVVALWRNLAVQRRARILLALEELSGLALKYCPDGGLDKKLIVDFVSESKRVNDIDEEDFRKGVNLCRCHGDLHGRNVLILQGVLNQARLVDPANIQQLHWASDVARLSVDLIVTGLNAGAESYEWELLPRWLGVANAFVAGVDSEYESSVSAALLWIRQKLPIIFSEVRSLTFEAEFRLALAVEFLRASYRQQDLAAPKRALGILAGCEAIRLSAKRYKEDAGIT